MEEELQFCLSAAKESMENAIAHLKGELSKIRAGKASSSMVESVKVDYYGSQTPLSQVANISTPDARSIMIQPWEKNIIDVISKAIVAAKLGFNPSNDGGVIHINVPPLTEERRKELVKRAKSEGETGKVSLRTARKEGNDFLKQLEKDGLSEDQAKKGEEQIQAMINSYNTQIDQILKEKEADILTV